MKNIWFSKLYIAIPIFAVFMMISAQLFPRLGPPLYNVKPAMAKVVQVHPAPRFKGRPGRYKNMTVTYYTIALNKSPPLIKQTSWVSENRRFNGNYKVGDTITVYHFPNRPHKAFLDKISPPQSLLITQIGFMIIVLWIAFLWRKAYIGFVNSILIALRESIISKLNSSDRS